MTNNQTLMQVGKVVASSEMQRYHVLAEKKQIFIQQINTKMKQFHLDFLKIKIVQLLYIQHTLCDNVSFVLFDFDLSVLSQCCSGLFH